MRDVVARFEFEEFFECQCLAVAAQVTDGVFVVAVENLVVGKADQQLLVVDETVVYLAIESVEAQSVVGRENLVETASLLFARDADE